MRECVRGEVQWSGAPPAPSRRWEAQAVDDIAEHVGSTASASSTQVIRAELIGPNRCTALGMTVRGSTPVLRLARELVARGVVDPMSRLEAWRGSVLALRVDALHRGAELAVEESLHGPVFRRFRIAPQSAVPRSRMRFTAEVAVPYRPHQLEG